MIAIDEGGRESIAIEGRKRRWIFYLGREAGIDRQKERDRDGISESEVIYIYTIYTDINREKETSSSSWRLKPINASSITITRLK